MNDALSTAIAIGSLGIGLISIAGAWIFKTFRGPNDISAELSAAIDKLRDEFTEQRRDHEGVARSSSVLANEVKHLSDSVKSLAEEVKGLRDDVWRPGPRLAKPRGA
jgi:hypothetical protein